MALIGTLRNKMGKILVIVVASTMLMFILTDLFQSNSTLFGKNDTEIAEISGNSIDYQEFVRKVEYLSGVFMLNQGKNPSSEELENIRKEAWNSLIIENAYQTQLDNLGLSVSDAEIIDMVQGNNIDPQIKQFFTDPNTGEFDRENVVSFLQQMNSAPAQQRQSWVSFESTLKPNRAIQKYNNLFELTNYVTTAEAKMQYQAQSSSMSVDYLYVPFFSVPDSIFKVTDSELKSYLSKHSNEYKRPESRSISYVTFPIVPSADDTAFILSEIKELQKGLANAQNDSTYASINTDGQNAFQSITDPGLFPEALKVDGNVVPVGTVSEPILAAKTYTILKLSGVSTGGENFVKGRHILIPFDDDKAKAKAKAQDLINQLKKGADFSVLAAANSSDQSNANNGGDLGWFGENGNFVQEFKDAAFGFRGTGLIPTPVETTFGYHIIRIDEPKTNTVYKVARIEKEFFASDETANDIYRKADLLSANSSNLKSFTENAEVEGYSVKTAANLGKNDTRIGSISNARGVISWLYNKASRGDVSDVFELENTYLVAVMTGVQEEGPADLKQVENELKVKVINEKKAAYIIEKLNGLSAGSYEDLKNAYGEGARTGTVDLTLSSNSFPNVGFAPEAIGTAFSLNEGEKTKPFQISNGVLMVTANSKNIVEETSDYTSYKQQLENTRRGRRTIVANFPVSFYPVFVSQSLDNAVKEFSEIEDNRYRFY